jgi:hypothetical protein
VKKNKRKRRKRKQRNPKLQFLNIQQHHLLMIQKEINSEHGLLKTMQIGQKLIV